MSWVDWDLAGGQTALLEFARGLAALRRKHPVFRRRRFFRGRPVGGGLADIAWLTPSGREMTDRDWNTTYARAVMVFLNGDAITEPGPRGEAVSDDSFLILLSASHEPLTFTLPGPRFGRRWAVTVDTAAGLTGEDGGKQHRAGAHILLPGHSMMALRRIAAGPPPRRARRSRRDKWRPAPPPPRTRREWRRSG